MKARRLLDLAIVTALFACATALPAQRVVDVRSQPLRAFATVSDVCVNIGDGTKGRPEGLLRVTGAAFGKDGLVLLSNTGTSEVLVFDSTGRYLRSVAREGGGPGELSKATQDVRNQRLLPYRGDSVMVFDTQRSQLLVFDGSGKFARSVRVDSLPSSVRRAYSVPGLSIDGDFALVGSVPSLPPGRLPPAGTHKTIRRDTSILIRVAAGGRIVWQSPPLEGAAYETITEVERPGPGSIRSMSRPGSTFPTTRVMSVALGQRTAYYYNDRSNEVHIFDRAGGFSVRVLLPPLVVPTTGTQSLFMIADYAGRAWLQVPQVTPGARNEWWVISESGELIGSVSTARGLLLAAGRSRLLLLAIGQDGVETIHSCVVVPARP